MDGAWTLKTTSQSQASFALTMDAPASRYAESGNSEAVPAPVAIALCGLADERLRAFLVPAAPNLAHAVFFAACARAVGRVW